MRMVGLRWLLSLERIACDIAGETASLERKPLSHYSSSRAPVRLAIQLDAARKRSRQFVACVAKNPQFKSQSTCFALRLLALGVRLKDDRHGAQELLSANLPFIEHLLTEHNFFVPDADAEGKDEDEGEAGEPAFAVGSGTVHFELYFTGDFAGVVAIEGSICGCAAEMMHAVPSVTNVADVAALKATVKKCDFRSTPEERTIGAHQPIDGEVRACDCACSAFRAQSAHAACRVRVLQRRAHPVDRCGRHG
eukprot:5442560-Pleurochrysis_carterae.AAC.2